MIIGCRFIPGGRTAITLTCGLVGYSRRRFVAATAVAAVIWASYAFLIGRLGGKAFEDQPWLGLLLALGVTVVISAAIEAVRRARAWHRKRSGSAHERVHTVCTPAAPGLHPARLCWAEHQAGGRGGRTSKDAVHAADATAHPGRSAVAE
jgi:hypothetical protein